ncbi:hypothetical protein [Algivirga pacifica]|uniref:Uncharacterized protein n=1 Tax=Algivirga pacifica TaxID=1162670 RepID=A0ABP9DRQ3_9BACT
MSIKQINIRELPKRLQARWTKAKKVKDETELEIIQAIVEEKYPKALQNGPTKGRKTVRKPSGGSPKVTALGTLFHPINAIQQNEDTLIKLPGAIGQFIRAVERNEYALVLRGDRGAGKTRFLFQLINAFGSVHGVNKIGLFSLEIAENSHVITQMRNEYIVPHYQSKVFIAGKATSIETISQAAAQFDVVAIDSFNKIPGIRQEDFDKLRKAYPNTFFLVIFQSTTAGTARGGIMSEYDAQAVIHIKKGGIAIMEKNRYASGEEVQYDVFNQKIIEE